MRTRLGKVNKTVGIESGIRREAKSTRFADAAVFFGQA